MVENSLHCDLDEVKRHLLAYVQHSVSAELFDHLCQEHHDTKSCQLADLFHVVKDHDADSFDLAVTICGRKLYFRESI